MVQIEFFTLIAQVINFLILVLLLRHFLYKRILNAVNEREKRIASRLEEALQKKKEAEEEAESYRKIKQELLDKREEMLAGIREEALALRKDLIKKARDEVQESKARWYEDLDLQKVLFMTDLRRRTGEEIYAIARHALHDLANEDLEHHMINTFIKRLQNMKEDEEEAVRTFDQEQEILIKSAFEIPEKIRLSIQEVLRGQTGSNLKIRFWTAPDLICGVELEAGGMKIIWSLNSYLDSLEEELSKMLGAAEKIEIKEERSDEGKG